MSLRRPVAPDGTGALTTITAPDTIDPAILPASGGVPITLAATYTVGANTQAVGRYIIIPAAFDVVIPANSELILV